jgi:hypothetical protein
MASDEPAPGTAGESLAAFILAAGAAAVGSADPSLAAVAAGAGGAAMLWVPRLMQAVRTFRANNLARTALAATESTGRSLEEIATVASQDPFRQQLTADFLEAASRAAYDAKLLALGRSWAKGVLTPDDAERAREQQFIRSIARLEYPHIRLLDVISGDFLAAAHRHALVDGWTYEAVIGQLPEYGPIVVQLASVLTSEGLVANQTIQNPMVAGTQFRITAAGEEVLARIAVAAESIPEPEDDRTPT